MDQKNETTDSKITVNTLTDSVSAKCHQWHHALARPMGMPSALILALNKPLNTTMHHLLSSTTLHVCEKITIIKSNMFSVCVQGL